MDYMSLRHIPEVHGFTPSFQLQTEERRSLADSTQVTWRSVSNQRKTIAQCFTLSDDAVNVVETELNILEKEGGRVKQKDSMVLSADVVANQLKHSNQRPTSDQVSVLKTLLAQKNSELSIIESDLLRLQLKINDDISALKELERSKAEKQTEANSYESWLVSVRLLPIEVITRIFQYSIYYRGPSTMRKTSPFSLSRVCSAWRSSALSCSSFWNDLELELSNFPIDHRPHLGLLLDLWYSRANRHRPLSISLTGAKYADEDLTINLAPRITKFSPRITTVFVDLWGGTESLTAFLASPGGSFSNLKSLTFIDSDFTAETNTYPITVFDHSPRLRKVMLRIPPGLFEGDSRLFLPWNQLTHLYVGGPLLMQTFAIIIFQCTQLQVASFPNINLADRSDNREPILPPEPVEFPHLTDLRIRLDGPFFSQDISDVFEMMLLPSVKRLDMAGFSFSFYSGDGDLFPADSLMPSPTILESIRHLLLAYVDITRDELPELLVACPLLESLTVCLNIIDPIALLKDLLVKQPRGQPSQVPPLSHLTSFTFACIIPQDDDENSVFDHVAFTEAFTALVTSWITDSNRHCPLQKISLFICNHSLQHNKMDRNNRGENVTMFDVFEKMQSTLQNNFAGLVDDSVFSVSGISDYEELLSIFGFEKRSANTSYYPFD